MMEYILCTFVTLEALILIILLLQTIRSLYASYISSKLHVAVSKLSDISTNSADRVPTTTPDISEDPSSPPINTKDSNTSQSLSKYAPTQSQTKSNDISPFLARVITTGM